MTLVVWGEGAGPGQPGSQLSTSRQPQPRHREGLPAPAASRGFVGSFLGPPDGREAKATSGRGWPTSLCPSFVTGVWPRWEERCWGETSAGRLASTACTGVMGADPWGLCHRLPLSQHLEHPPGAQLRGPPPGARPTPGYVDVFKGLSLRGTLFVPIDFPEISVQKVLPYFVLVSCRIPIFFPVTISAGRRCCI